MGSRLLSDGSCAVQDEAAGLVVALLDPQPGDSVADVCAAPGGKALFTAARLCGQVRTNHVLSTLSLMVRSRKKIKSRHPRKHRSRLAKAQKPRTPHVVHERDHRATRKRRS